MALIDDTYMRDLHIRSGHDKMLILHGIRLCRRWRPLPQHRLNAGVESLRYPVLLLLIRPCQPQPRISLGVAE